jgi:sialate O-acetylesterase
LQRGGFTDDIHAVLIMRFVLSRFVLVGVVFFVATTGGAAEEAHPLLSPVFGDHMVLQRGKPNPFWGWAQPGREVRVTIGEHAAHAVAATDGRWAVSIDVPPAGGPYVVDIEAGEKVTLRDVLVGDVWLCGGQSNMELPLRVTDDGEREAQQANAPTLRLAKVPRRVAYTPGDAARVEWSACTPEAAPGFSAVAYYFGRKLQSEVGVPIGLIQDCLGGSPAEAWMSAATLTRLGEFGPQLQEIARLRAKGGTEYGSFLMHWLDEHDIGGKDEAWAKPEFDDRTWKTVPVPGGFRELGVPTEPAVVWFRREIALPDPLPAGAAKIFLGVVERMDTVYVNGRWTGASSWVENPRVYTIPAGALRPGRNVIAVRVFKTKPAGGFMSPPETLRVRLGDGREVPLAGDWRAAVSFDARPPASLPLDFDNYPTMPTVLYDGMIAPVAPLAITGAIWYQGEANAWRPQEQYRKLLPALIADWRAAFGQGEFPFYIVSLPAFMARKTEPGTDGWAELREAQAFTARNVRNTGLAVTIDTGDANDIHPKTKRPVGERLALCALAGHYRRDIVASGPTLRLVERRPGALALHFDHADGGLQVRGDKLEEFSVAGEDRTWHWAEARLEGKDVVVVSSREVPEPVVVRYAWQGNPRATLFNGAGLPAGAFRTDE